ncbi:hypothetical protein [Halomonas chromatireducens]|uniref:DUF2214 domain-containing protein n=1 Tax=Halomonas chromatireducens TaxID=507626 RepID=A0A109UKM3_9GAMM|nr:hypothetical protein [Halomonas chromatireducens]AMC99151.1 hypothetical protein LOKO_00047 [Halomonas chromatireducens]
MEELLTRLAATPLAEWMRLSRWGYAAVNTLHVLGIGLMIGAIAALDLRLMGWRRDLPLSALARLLQPVAIGGLLLAIAMGGMLFLADPTGYAGMPLFQLKLGLIGLAIANALLLNLGPGLAKATALRLRISGALSLGLWLSALVAGRFLAFVDG